MRGAGACSGGEMSAVTIPYGAGSITLPLRGRLVVAAPLKVEPLGKVPSAVLSALEHPHCGAPLRRLVAPGEPVTVVVSDRTRVTGARQILGALMSYLSDCGVAPERISLLFATGIHRRQTPAEQAAVVGDAAASGASLVDHDPDGSQGLRAIGTTKAGTPVVLNHLVSDGRLVILTGSVSFHYLAGFGGGRKSILPGVAGREAILAFHRHSLSPKPEGGRHPCAWPGVVAGNPLAREAREAAAMLSRTFLLNTAMTPAGEIARLFSGEVEGAFASATEWCRANLEVTLPAAVPFVIVGAGGSPRDSNLVQAHKALEMVWRACVPGGVIVLVAECGDGLGNERMAQWFEESDSRAHEKRLRERFEVNGFTALALRWKSERLRIALCSSLPPSLVRRMGMTPVAPEEIWDYVDSQAGPDTRGVALAGGAVPVLLSVRDGREAAAK